MIAIESDNAAVEGALRKFEKQAVAGGGYLNDGLGVRCVENNVSVFSPLQQKPGVFLVAMPESCLLPLDKITCGIDGGDIVIRSLDPALNEHQSRLFETLFEICNLTGKMASHNAASPYLAFRDDPETLGFYFKARPDFRYAKQIIEAGYPDDMEAFTLEIFFHTRHLKFRKRYEALMPFIDFANHHNKAFPYSPETPRGMGPGIALMLGKADPDSDESFVQYNFFDAMDTCTIYGFADLKARVVRSIPLIIPLGSLGTIHVKARQGVRVENKLTARLGGLRTFMPKVMEKGEKTITLSHLFVPGPNSPRALRRVLARFIRALDADLAEDAVNAHVAAAEKRVIGENLAFYSDFLKHVKAKKKENEKNIALGMAETVAEHQLSLLKAYRTMEQEA